MIRDILISAGEASGDLYAALLVDELRRIWPDAHLFGCTGPRMRRAGVETVVDAASLAVSTNNDTSLPAELVLESVLSE